MNPKEQIMRTISLRRRFATAMIPILAALGFFGTFEAVAPSAAVAAYSEVTPGHCNSGPAGAVCARLFYDPVRGTTYAYGAIDPAPGHRMTLVSVLLRRCFGGPGLNCSHPEQIGVNRISTSHLSAQTPTDGLDSPCVYYFASILNYAVDGVPRSAPAATAYYHRSC
jgi:hypothetical protein